MAYAAVDEAFRLAREQNALLREVLREREARRQSGEPMPLGHAAVDEAFRMARGESRLLREVLEARRTERNRVVVVPCPVGG